MTGYVTWSSLKQNFQGHTWAINKILAELPYLCTCRSFCYPRGAAQRGPERAWLVGRPAAAQAGVGAVLQARGRPGGGDMGEPDPRADRTVINWLWRAFGRFCIT